MVQLSLFSEQRVRRFTVSATPVQHKYRAESDCSRPAADEKDIKLISNSLDKLCSISGYTYTRIDTGNRESGLIAQEVNNILPEVIYNTNTLMTISYGNMAGIIIEAIKELKNKIDDLEKVVYRMDILP